MNEKGHDSNDLAVGLNAQSSVCRFNITSDPRAAMLVDKMEGFVSNQNLWPVNEGDPYVVYLVEIG